MSDRATCPLCAGTCPLRFRVNAYAVHRCAGCDLEFVWPPASPEAIDAVYAQGYFQGEGAGYDDYFGRERDLSLRKAAVRLDALDALGVRRGRVLDVGCAAGFFLEAARTRGFEVYGVEHSAEARDRLDPHLAPRVVSTLREARDFGPFDVITWFDALEHLPDPYGSLRQAREMTVPGGHCAVVLPVLGSVNTRLAPRTWDQYKPPEHLWFWSRRAMRDTLRETLGATVLREDTAWRRDGRFIDPDQRSEVPVIRALSAVDRLLGRALSAIRREWVIDSVAFYARLP